MNSIEAQDSTSAVKVEQRKNQNSLKNPKKGLILPKEEDITVELQRELTQDLRSIASPKGDEKGRLTVKPDKSPIRGPSIDRVPA